MLGVGEISCPRHGEALLRAALAAGSGADRERFARWTSPRSLALEITAFDATTGGRWGYVARSEGGDEFGFRGIFHTVESDALIIQTFEFSGAPGAAGIGATTFEALDGRTRIAVHEVYPSVEARDMALANGMEYGITESYERLDEALVEVSASSRG